MPQRLLLIIGLLADIHGNHRALAAVLKAASNSGVERLLIAGDLIGYYSAPLQVMEMLLPWPRHIARGNHEDMLQMARADRAFLAQVDMRYGTGLRIACEQLGAYQLNNLCCLPHPLDLNFSGFRILLCHGSPTDIDQYIYPDSPADLLQKCAVPGYDLVVLGHTHHPMSFQSGNTLLANPGSVGQPRNRKPGASWAVFDTAACNLQFRTEQYDYRALSSECQNRHPELPYLAETLLRT